MCFRTVDTRSGICIREDRQIAAGHLASRDNASYLLQHEQPVLNKTQRYQLQMLDSIID
jgi:hypothetical protein